MILNNSVLIQQASGHHIDLLDLSYSWHSEYAQRHYMDYWCIHGQQQAERHSYWEKIFLIRKALSAEHQYQWVFWLDADAVIVQIEKDIREALQIDQSIGMVLHPDPPHVNAGVIYIKNTLLARQFLDAVWSRWPVNHAWEDQAAINQIWSDRPDNLTILPAEWNSTDHVNDVPNPVVRAWHGFLPLERRVSAMRDTLNNLSKTAINNSRTDCQQ